MELQTQSTVSMQSSDCAATQLAVGRVLRGRYVLETEIGRGGQCVIFRAKDLHRVTAEDSDGGRIALKLLHPLHCHDERAVARLAREFRQMQALAHPSIARVFDFDRDGDIWFISMELIEGQPVSQWMLQDVPLKDAFCVIRDCCEALEYAHSLGIVHGDLKPSNVLRVRDGSVKLIDFGSVASHHVGDETVHSVAESSTPAYASPQVLAGMRAEIQDDVFSVACLSYGILSEGARPFGDATSLEAHRARLCPAVIAGMPVELFSVLSRSLAGDRVHRPASTSQFYRDLLGSGVDPGARVHARSRTEPAGRTKRQLIQGLSVASLAAAGLCAAAVLLPFAQKPIAGTGSETSSRQDVSGTTSMGVPDPSSAATGDTGLLTPVSFEPMSSASAATALASGAGHGIVTFQSSALVAGSAQSMVAIPVRRLQSTHGATAVEWQVESGTAMPSIDYEPIKAQVMRFSEGESVRSLFIPLIRTAANTETRPPRSFTVLLRPVGNGSRLGAVTRIKVTIVPQPIYSDLGDKVALK
jgi:serine/threonine protein kinase